MKRFTLIGNNIFTLLTELIKLLHIVGIFSALIVI